ncbi:hypothetical protein HPB51_026334 [Rhipicephalus microplus]|uniref:Uncharacterized protein n=1 Tax=Rhipicephalus microplus TaxID=6941 RepID=A0A9J6D3G4_RHIMP|nr:hypothetical protein HPB51_026334 [Rhipicephalus microplus]
MVSDDNSGDEDLDVFFVDLGCLTFSDGNTAYEHLSIEQVNARQPTQEAAAAFVKDVPAQGTLSFCRKKGSKPACMQQMPAAPPGTPVITFLGDLDLLLKAIYSASARPPLVQRPAVSSVPEDQPDAEGPFQEVRLKAALGRAKKLAAAALPVSPAVMGTVLYRPSVPGRRNAIAPLELCPDALVTP